MTDRILVIGFVVAVIAGLLLFFMPGDHATKLQIAAGYAALILVFFFGLVVLLRMLTGEIDLRLLISESGGGASMSRFQLLIFTFVIGLSLFYLTTKGPGFPHIPPEVLTLLGISATTYGVSKGIQAGAPSMPPKEPKPSANA